MGKWGRIAGRVIHGLIAAMMIAAGSAKAFSNPPPKELLESLTKLNMADKIGLIGWGEILSAVVLLIPRTRSLGVLLASGFWGGVILAHMVQRDSYLLGSVFLVLTWVGGYLRDPMTLHSFFEPSRPAAVESHAVTTS